MKTIKNISYILTFICASMMAVSCYDDALEVYLEELGTKEDEFVLPIEEGTLEVEYYSNLRGTVKFAEEVEWARLDRSTFDGDDTLHVEYDYNCNFPRLARIVFESDDDSRTDTIIIKQRGELIPTLQLQKNNLVVYNDEGSSTTRTAISINSNIDLEKCETKIQYTGLKDDETPVEWIKNTGYAGGQFIVETENNSMDKLRNAVITISYTDGWEERKTEKLFLTQATKENKLGSKAEFDFVRSLAAPQEAVTIPDDIYIEGYIISDVASGNVAENPMTTNTAIDYKRTERCAYIVSTDGKYGFLLETASVDDNNFKLNNKVQILLKGTTLECRANPLRFSIKDITGAMIIYSEHVDESEVPIKVKHINELTDEDLYTRIKLIDCEFPCRKGGLTPINEGYANACGVNRINMFPTLIRDINGDDMYILTNTTCMYRRNGERMGYGAGSVTGVLVHEKYRRFIDGDSPDEDECGTFSRYQIRHQKKADIDFAHDFEDGFSEILTEYAYFKPMAGMAWAPTYGNNGEFRHTYIDEDNPQKMYTQSNYSFSYLGPCGDGKGNFGDHKGNDNGFGIIIDGGEEWGRDLSGVNGAGKGIAYWNRNVAFCNGNWWDDSVNRPYAWLVKFSTKGIRTSQLSLQMAVFNYGINIPTFWKVEWSEQNDMSPEADKEWKPVGEYYCPDKVEWSPTQLWQGDGYKPINFRLPLEMLDKEEVYLRIMPRNKICSSKTGLFDGQLLTDGKAWNAIDYFGIRYNK